MYTQTQVGTPTTRVVNITPSLAKDWLKQSKRNRPVSKTVVIGYRRDMDAGEWAFTGDPIRFSVNGDLIDGQHRLMALAELGVFTSIPMLVIDGLPEDSQLFMDQGRKRGAGGQLALLGVKNANGLAASAKFYIVWQEGFLFKDSMNRTLITSRQIQAWVADNPDMAALQSLLLKHIKSTGAPTTVASAAAFKFSTIDLDSTIEFFETLASGVGLKEGHPILVLDRRLRKIRNEGLSVSTRDYLSFFILAWNAWREGRSLARFQRPRGGSWSVTNFPIAK